jgi:hypothetical protein
MTVGEGPLGRIEIYDPRTATSRHVADLVEEFRKRARKADETPGEKPRGPRFDRDK